MAFYRLRHHVGHPFLQHFCEGIFEGNWFIAAGEGVVFLSLLAENYCYGLLKLLWYRSASKALAAGLSYVLRNYWDYDFKDLV